MLALVYEHPLEGYAFIDGVFTNDSTYAEYKGATFIHANTNTGSGLVPPHEMLHLLGADHVEEPWNLMYGYTFTNKTIASPKRLIPWQSELIRTKNSKYLK